MAVLTSGVSRKENQRFNGVSPEYHKLFSVAETSLYYEYSGLTLSRPWPSYLLQFMRTRLVIQRLDEVLKSAGFKKQKAVWNRRSDPFVDVVDLQISKGRNTVTVNAGVVHPDIYTELWGETPPRFIEEPMGTVRARIGKLIDGRDFWWKLDEANVADDIVDKVKRYALPFLEQMHSTSEMEKFLTSTRMLKDRYPPPIIYLAILRHKRGDVDAARALLMDLRMQTEGAWRGRIDQIAEKMS